MMLRNPLPWRRLALLVGTGVLAIQAVAQTTATSDELTATLVGQSTPYFTGFASTPPAGQLGAPIGFARVQVPLFGWQKVDVSSFLPAAIGLTATTVSDAKLATWVNSIAVSGAELFLTEPGAPGTVSDAIFRFSATVSVPGLGNGTGDAIVMFSDPLLVSKLAALPHLSNFSSIAETGSLQEVNSLLYLTTISPFSSIQVLSAVPEPSGWALMFVGMGLVGGLSRRTAFRSGSCPEAGSRGRRPVTAG